LDRLAARYLGQGRRCREREGSSCS
jgi:hypothetical protein